jgi:hypothetical protein
MSFITGSRRHFGILQLYVCVLVFISTHFSCDVKNIVDIFIVKIFVLSEIKRMIYVQSNKFVFSPWFIGVVAMET